MIAATSVIPHPFASPRPGWLRTGWELLLAYLWTALVLVPPALLLGWLGLIDTGTAARPAKRWVDEPFYPAGAWAVAADVTAAVVVVLVTSTLICWSFHARTGYRLRPWLVFATIAATGWAPLVAFHLFSLSSGTAFLATLVVMRLTAEEALADEPARPFPRRLILGTTLLALLLVGSYGVFHPIREPVYGTGGSSVLVELHNGGFADLRIVSLGVPAERGVFGLPQRQRPLGTPTLAGRHGLWVALPVSACRRRTLTVRYRLFGRTWTQPLLLPLGCGDVQSR